MNKNNEFFHKQLDFNLSSSKKRLKLFGCFKLKICPKGVVLKKYISLLNLKNNGQKN